MLASRKRPLPYLVAVTLLLILFLYHSDPDQLYMQWASPAASPPQNPPANKTLGFGAVVVVSKEASERRHSLLQAANVTDLELTIPRQPEWTEGDVEKFRNEEEGVQRGSILAWLGHHTALRWFLDSGLETALILEDDVDWDIQLRSIQIPLAAAAARSVLPPARSIGPFPGGDENHTQYWGNPKHWDLLYLGHCGDYFTGLSQGGLKMDDDKRFNLTALPHVLYDDPSLPVKSDLHPFTHTLFDKLGINDHQRAFHRSQFPLCSFGYAVTRASAERLLSDLAPPKIRHGGPRAFDVALLHACTRGSGTPSPTPHKNPHPHPDPKLRHKYASPGLRCWTLNSELFHHMPGESQIASIDKSLGKETGIPPVDFAGQVQVVDRNETTNIGCGFWGGAFAFDEEEPGALEFLQEQVGRKGHCLKPGRETNKWHD